MRRTSSHVVLIVAALLATATLPGAEESSPPHASPHPETRTPPGAFAAQPESTRRMAEYIDRIWNTADPLKNRYRSADNARVLGQQVASTTSVADLLSLLPRYAQALVESGRPDDALVEFERFRRMITDNQLPVDKELFTLLLMSEAACFLRIGEQQNCLANHNADSCLMPIQGGGVHLDRRGSEGAVKVLTRLLDQSPDDLGARWLLNIAYMTLGEYPDGVPPRWRIDPTVFASDYDVHRFPDVAGPLGLDVNELAGGVVLDDFDNDGCLDVLVSGWSGSDRMHLFRNNGDGTFTERTHEAGLDGLSCALNMVQADYNNDGFVDVYVLRGAWFGTEGRIPNSLLRNNGDFTFTDVTEDVGMLSFNPTQTAAWFDYNSDGWLDLFVGNESQANCYSPCELYRNNGDGTFTETALLNGCAIAEFVKAVAAGDYDNDGRPDLFLSCRDGAQVLLHNDGPAGADKSPRGRWKFSNATASAGITEPHPSFPCWFYDYDNDGWLDLMVTGYLIDSIGDVAADAMGLPNSGQRARLYHNNRDGTFTDISEAVGVSRVLHAMSANFGDLDNDGWLDFYLGTGDPTLSTLVPNLMFRNNAGHGHQNVTTSGGFGQLQKGHAIAFGDIDNDGDQDIYSVVGGAVTADIYPNQLFANPGHGNRWLTLKLVGTASARSANGARIKVVVRTSAGRTREIHRVVGSGASFGASPLRQEIGLGDAVEIESVEIRWPVSGSPQLVEGLDLDSFYEIHEGASAAIHQHPPRIALPVESQPAAHVHGGHPPADHH